jgi:flagella basal body P-ring formation protein FlgA
MAYHTQALAAVQDHQVLHEMVIAFVQQQTSALHDKVNYRVEEIDPRLALSKCDKIEVFLPYGTQLLGKISVGVRCADAHPWSIFVPVQIKTSLDLLVSTRQLPAGHTLHEEDFYPQTIEVTQAGGMTDLKQAIGKVLRSGISAGQILREDMLRAPFSVIQGLKVRLVVQANGFSISGSGLALANASEGQLVKVKNEAGGVVSGLARASGVVEIAP